ncbi:hypothetical protein GQ44DRAFT_715861 [Phaeosphaeriaceae sp. PMI808]|nr:hypothetical protein GQ44DRAFT_715861 [Phaeosphaeriaceae sp. PMI808]
MDMPETRAQIDYTPIEYHLNPYRNTVENVWLSMSKIDGDDEASKASVDSWLHALEYTPPYKPLYEGRMISTGWYKDLVRFATSYQLHECLKRLKYWYPQNKNYVWPPDWGPDAYDKIKAIYMGTNTRSRVPFKGKHKDYAMTQGENGRFLDDITATATTTTASPFPSSMAMCSEETLQLDPFSRQCHICNVSLTQRYWYQRETNHRNIYAKTGIGPPPKSQYPTRSYSPPPPPPEPRRTDCNCETGFTNSRLVHVESAGQRRERERSAAEQRYREDKEGRARERERRDRARSEERRQAYANRPYDYGGGGNGE